MKVLSADCQSDSGSLLPAASRGLPSRGECHIWAAKRQDMTDLKMTAVTQAEARQGNGGDFRIGSEEHKVLFCRMFLDSYDPNKPAVIQWPDLAPDALARLTGLPFWDIAVRTEESASRRMEALAGIAEDPL